jgi:hypothetical protein
MEILVRQVFDLNRKGAKLAKESGGFIANFAGFAPFAVKRWALGITGRALGVKPAAGASLLPKHFANSPRLRGVKRPTRALGPALACLLTARLAPTR